MAGRCCPGCFGDRGLRVSIIPALNPAHGKCDFCGDDDVDLVEPQQLADVFGLLVSAYEPNPRGKSLVKLMREDWQLFLHPVMDDARANALLAAILSDGEIVQKPFLPSSAYESVGLARWDTLRNELMYKNRYFPDEELDGSWLGNLFDLLQADGLSATWYRARILARDAPYTVEEMGPPPKRLASHGRANPAGIPYLYLSSGIRTAIAEVRPYPGEVVCVADFAVAMPVAVVDLRNPRKLVSPFILGSASAVGQLRADIPFLERLGEELTRPVVPSGAAIDYVPSQYMCEFIKKQRYDGVIYRSAVADDINLALFDTTKATGGSVSRYMINKVDVEPLLLT